MQILIKNVCDGFVELRDSGLEIISQADLD